ncbi:gas vesicle protein [Aphanothece hegewaldii CCALA 016]|uniref:Gas vesicle protein n=1 Tax=Aphanothece hegewaldii CCALA 016 TaxID=2107694 RepID=A0A2T1LVW9_9CHRO|nr:YtxH domain-containing protein [Aphanothece hegewaldii]PSF35997.1 gas vesicle protein [Aphanothece hegewaldii CCALA 016]
MSNKSNGGLLFAGLVVGGVLGTVTGLLIAPRSGQETRRILKKSAEALPELAEDLSSTIQLQADRLSDTAKRNWDDTLERLKEAIAAGIEASQVSHSMQQTRDPNAELTPVDQHLPR